MQASSPASGTPQNGVERTRRPSPRRTDSHASPVRTATATSGSAVGHRDASARGLAGLPARDLWCGSNPAGGGRVVKTHSPLRRTEPSARGVAPATASVARPATGGRAAWPQDLARASDSGPSPCESAERQSVKRPPASFSHSSTAYPAALTVLRTPRGPRYPPWLLVGLSAASHGVGPIGQAIHHKRTKRSGAFGFHMDRSQRPPQAAHRSCSGEVYCPACSPNQKCG